MDRVWRLATAMLAVLLLPGAAWGAQTVHYVDDDGAPGGDCGSWPQACPDLQSALGQAQAGDEVRVAQGIYTPAEAQGDRTVSFQLLSGVQVKGGYLGLSAGPQQDPDERQVWLYATILSGDLNQDDGPGFAGNTDNSHHLVTAAGTDPSAMLDGFTVTAGNADGAWPHDFGGGMYIANGSPTVSRSSFVGNTGLHGGAVHISGGGPTFLNCYFVGNEAGAWGAAVDNFSAWTTLINCALFGNTTAGDGGAVHSDLSEPHLINCTVSANTANRGGGLFNYAGAIVTLTNSIVWANSDSTGSGESAQLYVNAGENDFVVNHTCVEGWTGGFGGTGNMGDDPLMADPQAGNYRLLSASPCVDAGSNMALPRAVTADLDGQPRFVDGDGDSEVVVDMGAYEFQGPACSGDLDGNGEVGAADLALLLGAWGPNAGDPADLDGDGAVDAADLALLLGSWGSCASFAG